MFVFIIFAFCVIAIAFFLFYSPLYFIGYKVFAFDKKIGDKSLALAISIMALVLSIIFFKTFSSILLNLC
ncbi:Uncharacterised protein [Sphingobacterium multivorum]|uniref:DUF1146 domain-containing protein n=1 Tax=Sphingobacterium multivorum TaxID=28454 RepID=A0A2X2IMN6_SPHMU|nr:Uncharacterised protein [Sphingobacterium multivorum]